MKMYVKGRNLKVTQAQRAYAEEKIGHLSHYLDQIESAHVTLRTERELQIVDVVLNLKHFLIKAEERSPDMHASIDLVRDQTLEPSCADQRQGEREPEAQAGGKDEADRRARGVG